MIIGICGLIGSGKDTIADCLVEQHNFQKISFADKLKDAVAQMFDWDRHLLDGKTDESRAWREQPDVYWSKEIGSTITPRLALQKFGTECMRNGFYDGIWVSLTKKKIIENPQINWVIPDVRFVNEADMIKSVGGKVWWVKRGTLPLWFKIYQDVGTEPKDIHASEWAWARFAFDAELNNNSTISALRSQVQGLLAPI